MRKSGRVRFLHPGNIFLDCVCHVMSCNLTSLGRSITKEILESVARMNKTVRTLDSIENIIKQLVKILSYTHNFVK